MTTAHVSGVQHATTQQKFQGSRRGHNRPLRIRPGSAIHGWEEFSTSCVDKVKNGDTYMNLSQRPHFIETWTIPPMRSIWSGTKCLIDIEYLNGWISLLVSKRSELCLNAGCLPRILLAHCNCRRYRSVYLNYSHHYFDLNGDFMTVIYRSYGRQDKIITFMVNL
jgi:hypothetical protein